MEIATAILMSLGLAISLIVMSKARNTSNVSLEQYLLVLLSPSVLNKLLPYL